MSQPARGCYPGMMHARVLLVVLAAVVPTSIVTGCEHFDDPPRVCAITIDVDYRPGPRPKVFGGTIEPSLVPIREAQLPAIGSLYGCSGTLIAPTWVLSAKHCRLTTATPFCVGKTHNDANLCTPVVRVVEHPVADIVLLELEHEPAELLPGLEPIAIATEGVDCSWLGQNAEAAGYGRAPNLGFGNRFFTVEPIVAVSPHLVTIDGLGRRGMCDGDSGGPLMVEAADGSVRVIGALQGGDVSCRGLDDFTRIVPLRGWIEEFTGPTAPLLEGRR